jgi:uncharacterized protein (DUF924 family)
MTTIDRVLEVWFGDDFRDGEVKTREKWFNKDPIFDQSIREWFGGVHVRACEGRLDDWMESAEGCLAMVLVFDQFPRHMFRGTAAAFASDGRALRAAAHGIDMGFDDQFVPVMQQFFYFPLEHSEDRSNQAYAVKLFKKFESHPELGRTYEFALRHQAVVERFGRFPHRNEALGRVSTACELAFLSEPGSGF